MPNQPVVSLGDFEAFEGEGGGGHVGLRQWLYGALSYLICKPSYRLVVGVAISSFVIFLPSVRLTMTG